MNGILPSVAQNLNRDEVGVFGDTVLGTSSGTTEKVRLLRNRQCISVHSRAVSSVTIAIGVGVAAEGSSPLGAPTEGRLDGKTECGLIVHMLGQKPQETCVSSVDASVDDIDVDT